jgi:hypothetical protein
MTPENADPRVVKIQRFSQSLRGTSSVYDPPIENLEQAVAIYNLATEKNDSLDRIQVLGLWKATIIFCAMCLEAYWSQIGGGDIKIPSKKRGDPKGLIWIKCALSKGIRLEEDVIRLADEIFSYRDASVHSIRLKSNILLKKTSQNGAYSAICHSRDIYAHLHGAFNQGRPDLVAWVTNITAKALTPRFPESP